MREKAISARLPAFSISSRQSRMTSGLRRISTPPAPIANRRPERTRYQLTSTSAAPLPAPSGEHDRADGGDQEQHRGGLEDDQEALQQQVADLRRGAEVAGQGRPLGADRLEP